MKVGVFCSANDNIAQEFFEKIEELGRWLGKEGHTLVYGGSNNGLMECIARAVKQEGGQTIGMIPQIIEQGGKQSKYVDIEFPCDNLTDRKELMMTQSDVFIALPGGIGTLDEVFTVAASATIGYHHKPVILYNIDNCWASLIALLDNLQANNFIRGQYSKFFIVASTLEEVQKAIAEAER